MQSSAQTILNNNDSHSEYRKKLVFNHCPNCGSDELIEFGADTLCCHCNWDSCSTYVEEGLMDNRFQAFKELYNPKNKVVYKKSRKKIENSNLQLIKVNNSDSTIK